jgi:hypothetical protein
MLVRRTVKIYGPDHSELIEVTELERSGNNLVIRGQIMGSLPMTAVVRPNEGRNALSLLNFKLAWFLLTFLFRSGRS